MCSAGPSSAVCGSASTRACSCRGSARRSSLKGRPRSRRRRVLSLIFVVVPARSARLHEPMVALDGGHDGLDVLRRIIVAAAPWLAPGGRLLVETSEAQAPALAEAMARAG